MRLIFPEKVLLQHLIMLGKTGAGKSSALRHIVEHLLRHNKRVVIVDPKGDWFGLKWGADGKSEGFPVILFGEFKEPNVSDIPINERSGESLAELITTGNRPCVVGLSGWRPGQMTQFWIDLAGGLFRRNRGELYVVGDEFHNFAPKGKILSPQAGECLHWSNRMLSEGRGIGIVCLLASQRPQKVHNDTLTSCETLVAMRVVHASDRQAVKDWIDGCGDKQRGSEVLGALAGMDRGEAYVWSPEIDYGPERIKFPMFQTFDSFAPPQLQKKVYSQTWENVDLTVVKQKLAAVIEEAKANDPAELKRKVSDLERKLRLAEQKAPVAQQSEPIKVPLVEESDLKLLRGLNDTAQEVITQIQFWRDQCKEISGQVSGIQLTLEAAYKRFSITPSKPPLAGSQVTNTRKSAHCVSSPITRGPANSRPAGGDLNGTLGKGERLVLVAIAQYPGGVTDEQIAVLTGYKKTSRNTYKQRLSSAGYIEDGGIGLIATEAGVAALGNFEVLPIGSALRDYWANRLSGGEKTIFTILEDEYPLFVAKETIEEKSNYKKTSVNTYCQRLAARQLVSITRDGVALSPNLFD